MRRTQDLHNSMRSLDARPVRRTAMDEDLQEMRSLASTPRVKEPPCMIRSSSAPYFASAPSREPYFSSSRTATGVKTSHYTSLAAPKTNSHFKNTLAGGDGRFQLANQWTTSNDAFYGDSHRYPLSV